MSVGAAHLPAFEPAFHRSVYKRRDREEDSESFDVFQRVMGESALDELLCLGRKEGKYLFTAGILSSDFFNEDSLKKCLSGEVYDGLKKRVAAKATAQKASITGLALNKAIFVEGLRLLRELRPEIHGEDYQELLAGILGERDMLGAGHGHRLFELNGKYIKMHFDRQVEQLEKLRDDLKYNSSFCRPESRDVLEEVVYRNKKYRRATNCGRTKIDIIAHSKFTAYDSKELLEERMKVIATSLPDRIFSSRAFKAFAMLALIILFLFVVLVIL